MIITNYFIRRKIKGLIKQPINRNRVFCGLKDACNILVLYNWEDRNLVEPFLETLRKQHKQVKACVYVSGELPVDIDPSCIVLQTKSDLDIWSMPREAIQKEFNSAKADILINLISGNNYVIQYLLMQHTCPFKVGLKNEGTDIYDFSIINTKEYNVGQLFEYILSYLQTITTQAATRRK